MDSLVSTQWLAEEIGSPNLVILDATHHLPAADRDPAQEFATMRIPGARFFDLSQLVDETSDVPQAHPRPEQLAELLAHVGIGTDREAQTRIVIYDDSKIRSSARTWFLLHIHGIENVAILDGGLAKWRSEGNAMESGDVGPIKPNKPIALKNPDRFRYKQEMLANIDNCKAQVIDARDAARFKGDIAGSGHIPGSYNLPFPTLFNEDGTYLQPSELSACFTKVGITSETPITATCGSGMTASVLLFALHLTGRDDSALYDGSWSEWGSDPDTPKAIGA